MIRYLCGLVVVAGLIAPQHCLAQATDDPYATTLADFKVTSDTAGVNAFLKSLHPSSETQREISKLITQLGDDEYSIREGAMSTLRSIPVIPAEELKKASVSPDPEVRWRSKEIMTQAGVRYAAILYAVLRTVERKKIPGVTAELIRAVPACTEEYLVRTARDAIVASSTAADADLLRAALKHENLEVRVAVTAALGNVLADKAATEMKPLLASTDERVRLAAARAMANIGDRESLETLGQLLASEDIKVRAGAIQTLRASTGQQIVFTAYDEPAARQRSIDEWKKWIVEQGPTFKLMTPLKETNVELGRTLICYYGQNKVVEIDAQGKEVWAVASFPQPWACQGLPNGHRLIASYNSRAVVEYDASGKEVWKVQGKLPGSPFSVERLENGNTLLACSDSQKVIEIDQKGDTKWEVTIQGRPMDARRLPDGKTLICLQSSNRVVEVDSAGKEVWKIEGLNSPLSAQRLENGNTLICETNGGRVLEYDRSGKSVWSQAGFSNPYDAQRLTNGNTLIAHNLGVKEIDRSGKEVWKKDGVSVSRVHRY